jgi:class 3 adenylate cyclase
LGLWKIETVGDAYIVAAGLFDDKNSASDDGDTGATTTSVTSVTRGSGDGAARRRIANNQPAHIRTNIDAALSLALSMQAELQTFRESVGLQLQMRIGIHVGNAVCGVVGSQSPRFCE